VPRPTSPANFRRSRRRALPRARRAPLPIACVRPWPQIAKPTALIRLGYILWPRSTVDPWTRSIARSTAGPQPRQPSDPQSTAQIYPPRVKPTTYLSARDVLLKRPQVSMDSHAGPPTSEDLHKQVLFFTYGPLSFYFFLQPSVLRSMAQIFSSSSQPYPYRSNLASLWNFTKNTPIVLRFIKMPFHL
jgi:hypothetical protein